jgi:DNA polymerase delta subunit 1
MPSVHLASSQKRVLGDSTNATRNLGPPESPSSKKRKLNAPTSPNLKFKPQGLNAKGPASSQQKSQFEEELGRLSSDIAELKESGSEKDQQWERPALPHINPATANLCFQNIDVEEGSLYGGKPAVRLFGVTEVGLQRLLLFLCESGDS